MIINQGRREYKKVTTQVVLLCDEGTATGHGHTAQREEHATGTQQAEAMEAGPRGGPSHRKPNVRIIE